MQMNSTMNATTVIIIVIGDEILKGQIRDSNSYFMATRLHAMGARVLRIIVIPDEVSTIAIEVLRASTAADYVITCGGIGPTHDDVTYEGIAKAFQDQIKRNSEMAKAMCWLTGAKSAGKMAQLPSSSHLLKVTGAGFPVVQCKNVFILPGVPDYCKIAFEEVEAALVVNPIQFYTQEIRIKTDELNILPQLNNTVERFKNRVTLGSYPFTADDGQWYTRVSLESTNVDDLYNARTDLIGQVPQHLIDMELTSADADRVLNLASGNTQFAKTVGETIKIIEEALEKYSSNDIFLSFNGGKDCTVLLHLVWAVCTSQKKGSIKTLYVKTTDPFPEITEFIEDCVSLYHLELESIDGPIKPALESLVARRPLVKAVWMGTRKSDPHAHDLNVFQMCDKGWPQLMRVSPLLEWSYQDIWTFLRCLAVPYCSLYDQGFTSIGNRNNTTPNPALLDPDTNTYKPAYTLSNGDLERNGRIK